MEQITSVSANRPPPFTLIDGITTDRLEVAWPVAWPYLKKAIDRFPNVRDPYTEVRVLTELFDKKSQLWCMLSDQVLGAALTSITTSRDHPGRKFVEVPLVGGTRMRQWGDPLFNLLKAWGLAHGCTDMVGFGRRGWLRRFGFEEFGETEDGILIMSRPLKDH